MCTIKAGAALGALSVVVLAAACGPGGTGSPAGVGTPVGPTTTATLSVGTYNAVDVGFASAVSVLATQAQTMARLATSRANHHSVTALAGNIQTRAHDVDVMRAWLRDWHHADGAPATAGLPGLVSSAYLESMESMRGNRFDDAWLEHMAANYDAAIVWCQREVAQGANPQARQMATTWLATMPGERNDVYRWHAAWEHDSRMGDTARSSGASPAPQPRRSSAPSPTRYPRYMPSPTHHTDDMHIWTNQPGPMPSPSRTMHR